MTLAFILTIPNRGSWNGQWSGQENLYAITRSFQSKKATDKANTILAKRFYSYGWSDGWRASIEAKLCKGSEAAGIRRLSKGFCGYDWMVDSILMFGAIYADHEKPEIETVPLTP